MPIPVGPIYLDTSALAKLYLLESGSDELNRSLEVRRDLQLSDLAISELVSAMAQRKREGDLSIDAAGRLHRTLLDHVASGHYLRLTLSAEIHRAAERLLLSFDAPALRAADALHLASALAAESRTLATFDKRMRRSAAVLGLALLPA